ncbi:hypothetical protein N7516_004692 [Penicillium verrucosum]|uniref:uncharacterized protein n=1 Tax=Penicillium verrucosum TaxID=60171 RepID=UPI002545AF0D|nr:uncharacterized protein N7516_004692 [Penicillium verrucosum]KAJ5944524.1 hypothetical protein N7516_004692 [Penicillium verrucosum]
MAYNTNTTEQAPITFTVDQYAELYATQLGILQEMGFCDSETNIEALKQANGNVNMAVDLLSNWSR